MRNRDRLDVPGILEPLRDVVSLPVDDLVDALDGRKSAEAALERAIDGYRRSGRAPGYAYLRVVAVEVTLSPRDRRSRMRWVGLETGFPSDDRDAPSPAFLAACFDVVVEGHEALAGAIEAWLEATP